MKLNEAALANSLATISVAFYLIFYILSVVTPKLFRFLFNLQFLGADVASLYPRSQNFGFVLVTLIVIGTITWIFGYVWALLYNNWAK